MALPIVTLLGCVVGANWALATFGVVPIGFGLVAPAGVFFAGLAFTARDAVRETAGRRGVALAIVLGGLLSFALEDAQRFALASALAFGVSETADALVYEPLRRKSWISAVLASNTVGLIVDSVLFLALAFGSLEFIEGQIVGKMYMTAIAVVGLWGWRALSLWRAQAHIPTSEAGVHGDA